MINRRGPNLKAHVYVTPPDGGHDVYETINVDIPARRLDAVVEEILFWAHAQLNIDLEDEDIDYIVGNFRFDVTASVRRSASIEAEMNAERKQRGMMELAEEFLRKAEIVLTDEEDDDECESDVLP